MSVNEDFESYKDKYGLIQPEKGVSGGNGLRYTSETMITLSRLNAFQDESINEFKRVLASCQVKRGLYKRHPNHPDQEGPDDYVAIISACSELNLKGFCVDIVEYGFNSVKYFGINFPFVYNNVTPSMFSKSAWFGRQLSFIAHALIGADFSLRWYEKLGWCYAVFMATRQPKSDQDSWILSSHLVELLRVKKRDKGLLGFFAKYFTQKRKEVFPNGMREAFHSYFGSAHPLALYWVDL